MRTLERQRFSERGPRPQVVSMGDHLAVMLLCLQAGQELRAPEDDTSETLFCVLAGAGEIVEGDERHAVGVGDVVLVPAGTQKALVAGGGTLSVLGVRHLATPRSVRGGHTMQTIDVRTIVPRERHPLLFRTFDALASGQSFELVNDHDPKPLYYQFQAERAGQLDWAYLEQGPDVWRVRIGKV